MRFARLALGDKGAISSLAGDQQGSVIFITANGEVHKPRFPYYSRFVVRESRPIRPDDVATTGCNF